MKIYKKDVLLLLSAVLCIILSVMFGMEKNEEDNLEDLVVTDINIGEVEAVILKNTADSLVLYNLPQGVFADHVNGSNYDQEKLKSLIYQLTHMKATREIETKSNEKYGLDDPVSEISILKKDETIRMKVGRSHPSLPQYYVEREDEGTLFLVNEEILRPALEPFDNLRDLSFYPFLDDENIKNLTEITIIRADEMLKFKRTDGEMFFHLEEPVYANVSWRNVEQKLIRPLREFTADDFVAIDQEFLEHERVGVPNSARLELVLDGERYSVIFQKKDEETYYCFCEDTGLLCTVDVQSLGFLDLKMNDLMGESIYPVSAADVSSVQVMIDNEKIEIFFYGEGESLSAKVGERILSQNEALWHFRQLSTFPAADVIKEDTFVEARSMLTLIFTLRNGEKDIIELYPVEERQAAVSINGNAEFTCYKTIVEDLQRTLKKLM